MLSFERRVAAAMIGTDDQRVRGQVLDFVDAALGAMPEILRAGIGATSVALASWDRALRLAGRAASEADLAARIEAHPLQLVRQWARALRTLVLFAENEMLEGATS